MHELTIFNFKPPLNILSLLHMVLTPDKIRAVQAELDVAGNKLKYYRLSTTQKDYGEVETLALDLGLQWEILLENNITTLDFPPECIMRYENDHYVLDLTQLDELNLLIEVEDGKGIIDCPFSYGDRMAPELMFALKVPAACSPNAALYALKSLCVELLGIEHNLNAIAGSKLYYLLERCSRPHPNERCFLFI